MAPVYDHAEITGIAASHVAYELLSAMAPSGMSAEEEVRPGAARSLVPPSAAGDLDAYFGSFADDATFLFHTTDRLLTLDGRVPREWARWARRTASGCSAARPTAARAGASATPPCSTHRVRTTVATPRGAEDVLHERETIVFHRQDDGRWLAVHEHLSVDPGA